VASGAHDHTKLDEAALVAHLHEIFANEHGGEVATYIPELAKVDPDLFGIAITRLDGTQFTAGDCTTAVTIQSVSKPFAYANVLEHIPTDEITSRVGIEPSGDPFNEISLDSHNRPQNPLINAGAIAVSSLAPGNSHEVKLQGILDTLAAFMGTEQVAIDRDVLASETATGYRNFAIAYMLKSLGSLPCDVPDVIERYFTQCSVLVTARELSAMAATLAGGGVNPLTSLRVISPETARSVLSVMLAAGMYDYAGTWLHDVGIPAKSGVSGAVIAVVPGRFGISVLSPRLDEHGNSVRGIKVCEMLARDMGLHLLRV
jgi:glutaminase